MEENPHEFINMALTMHHSYGSRKLSEQKEQIEDRLQNVIKNIIGINGDKGLKRQFHRQDIRVNSLYTYTDDKADLFLDHMS